MADTYEKDLGQKASLTMSDYIRVVGSDNVSYKQQIGYMEAPFRLLTETDMPALLKTLNAGTYFYRIDNVSGFPVTGGVIYRIVKTHGTGDARASILAIPMNATASIYTTFITSASATSITWVAQPTRAEIDAVTEKTTASLTAGTNITLASGFNNLATKKNGVVTIEFALTTSAAVSGGEAVAFVPSGYRPSKEVRGVCYFTDGYVRFGINSNGNIITYTNLASGKSVLGSVTYIV